jgi:hypothetical protein
MTRRNFPIEPKFLLLKFKDFCLVGDLSACNGGFPLGEIFRPNRNFLLSYKHADGTKQKSFEFEQ